MSLHAELLGGSEEAYQLARMLEGLLMAQVVLTLDRFGLPDLLAARPCTAGELASGIGADADALGRALAAASVYRLVRRDDAGRYTLTGTGDLLRSDADNSARGLAAGFMGVPLWETASRIVEVVQGKPVNPAAPGGLYEFVAMTDCATDGREGCRRPALACDTTRPHRPGCWFPLAGAGVPGSGGDGRYAVQRMAGRGD